MKRRASAVLRIALGLFLAACGGDSTGPSTGSLAVTVTGLPGGTAAAVSITGPSGFSRALNGSETLSGLAPGNYAVTANPVSAGGTLYAGQPAYQTVTVTEGSTPARRTSPMPWRPPGSPSRSRDSRPGLTPPCR